MANPTTPPKKEEIPAHIQAWQEETFHTGRGKVYQPEALMALDYCVFYEGVHYPGAECPHYEDGSDKEEFPTGWTVRNA